MAAVTIEGLTKHYGGEGLPAVKDVTLSVSDGEFMVLLGPSGCGKSSVLRMIAGLEPITAGTVSVDGRVMNLVPARDRDIAMVFQSYALYPHMDVYRNLSFGLRRRRVAREEIDRRVREVAARLGLSDFLHRKPHALSGGQRQRVALGRAIVRDPKVFLFDEPLSNLDASLRVSTRNELIKQQRELGTTTIYVTHDQVEAMTMGHRICIMNRGEVVQIGKPLDVYRNPADTFVARFLGNPPMNLLAGRVRISGGRAVVSVSGADFEVTGFARRDLARCTDGEVAVGLRPEDLYEHALPEGEGSCARLPVRVVAVEPLGAETLLVLEPAGTTEELIARIGRDTALRSGDCTTVAFAPDAVHLFDNSTSRALSRAPESGPPGAGAPS